MPISKPRSAAIRAEMASCTEAGCTHADPVRRLRKRSRRPPQRDGQRDGPRDGIRTSCIPRLQLRRLLSPQRLAMLAAARRTARRRVPPIETTGDEGMQEELEYAVLHEFVAPAKRNVSRGT